MWARLAPDVLQNLGASANGPRAADVRATVIDTLRAGLGEMVDLQIAEARRLEAELGELAKRVWPGGDSTGDDGYQRRWTVKE